MPVVGAAASAQHIECWQPRVQLAIADAKIEGVANIQFSRGIELGMAS